MCGFVIFEMAPRTGGKARYLGNGQLSEGRHSIEMHNESNVRRMRAERLKNVFTWTCPATCGVTVIWGEKWLDSEITIPRPGSQQGVEQAV
jgi:hypothetical protein